MTMTAAEREKLATQLQGNWWRLERAIPNDTERTQFVWDVARDGIVMDMDFCNTLGNHFDAAHTQDAVTFLGRAAEAVDDDRAHRGVKGWDYSVEWLVRRIAEEDPTGLLAARDRLPPLFRDFSLLFLAHAGARAGELPESARRRLAAAWASSNWDEDWFAVRNEIADDEWAALVLGAICEPDMVRIEWDRIKDVVGQATLPQALAILTRDESQHVRAHAATLLGGLAITDAELVLATIDALDPEQRWSAHEQRGALVEMLVAAYGRAGKPLPERLRALLIEDLARYGHTDAEVTLAALQTLDPANREPLIREALATDPHGVTRAVATAWAAATPPVLAAVLDRLMATSSPDEAYVPAIAGFGTLAVEPLLDVLGQKLPAATAAVAVRAIDAIGAPQAAPRLVELTGDNTRAVRDAAAAALQNLGAAARDAIRAGAQAKKKAVRETCAALLAQLEQSADSPLADLERRAARLEDPELDATLEDLSLANTHSSTDYDKLLKFSPRHGVLVAVRARDWFLQNPSDWHRSTVWQGLLGEMSEPEIAWLAVDAFAKLPANMYSYYVDRQLAVLREVVRRLPEAGGKALAHYLTGTPTRRGELLRVLLDFAPDVAPSLFVAALDDASKTVRATAVEGVVHTGAGMPDEVLALLGARKKDARLAAAEVFARVPTRSARKALEAALAKEKAAEVRTMLEQAVAAAGGSAFDFPGDDGEPATDADVDAFLAALNQPKLSAFVDLGSIELRFAASGTPMSASALHGFVGRLMKEDPDNTDEVARRVRPFLDDASANALSLQLLDAWTRAGSPAKDKWAVYQLAILAAPATLDQIAPQLDELASSSRHHFVLWFVDVLFRHGSRAAHSWLAYWAKNGERSSVQTAQQYLERAAQAAGKDVEAYAATLNSYIADDVADAEVPTLGLEAPYVVDYGDRKFEVFIDPNHNLVIRDEALKTYANLPNPRKDEALSPEQKAHVAELKKRLRAVVKEVCGRLEAGMVSGRPWTVAAFRELFGGHPIMSAFAGRLVFRADDGTLFRLSEGELLGAEYDVVDLRDDQTVRIAHPLQMNAVELDEWGQHFADAELVQPFEQLGRPIYDKETPIPLGQTTRGTVASRLKRLGWRRGYAEDAGMVYTASRLLAGRGVRAWVEHGGYYVGDPSWDAADVIDVSSVSFEDLEGRELSHDAVDPVAYSEILLELTQLLA